LREQQRDRLRAFEGHLGRRIGGRSRVFRRSARTQTTPMRSSIACIAFPNGIIQGLNSFHSPRIVTIMSSGKRQVRFMASMLKQLPTPLDCRSSTPRSPPSHAPASRAMPSSSVVRVTIRHVGSAAHSEMRRFWPVSGTTAT
jgi:hypothetical protein